MPDKLTALDSEDASVSVAEARHMVRKHMLLPALDALYEMGMNGQNRPADRHNCLKLIVEFAAEAQGSGSKTVGRLSPEVARYIAKLGIKNEIAKNTEAEPRNRSLPSDGAEEERLGGGGAGSD